MKWEVDITIRVEPPTVTHQAKHIIYVYRAQKGGAARRVPMMGDTPDLKRALAMYSRVLTTQADRPKVALQGYIEMELWFVWKWNFDHENWRIATPDWDNAAKTLQDALVKAGFILHDNQVVRAHVTKLNGPNPGIVIKLRRLPDFEKWELPTEV